MCATSCFSRLPTELLAFVAADLAQADLARFLVCSRHAYALAAPRLYRSLVLTDANADSVFAGLADFVDSCLAPGAISCLSSTTCASLHARDASTPPPWSPLSPSSPPPPQAAISEPSPHSTAQLDFADEPAVLLWPDALAPALSRGYGGAARPTGLPHTRLAGLPYPSHTSHARKRDLLSHTRELRMTGLVEARAAARWAALAATARPASATAPAPLFVSVTRLILGPGVLSRLADWAERHAPPAAGPAAHPFIRALARSAPRVAELCIDLAAHTDREAYLAARLPAFASARTLGPVAYNAHVRMILTRWARFEREAARDAALALAAAWHGGGPSAHVVVHAAHVRAQALPAFVGRGRVGRVAPRHTYRFPPARALTESAAGPDAVSEPGAIAALLRRRSSARVPHWTFVNAERAPELVDNESARAFGLARTVLCEQFAEGPAADGTDGASVARAKNGGRAESGDCPRVSFLSRDEAGACFCGRW